MANFFIQATKNSTNPKLSGGEGPNGFAPSQKQSIGVIQMHGMIRSSNDVSNLDSGPAGNDGAGGLKQISDSVQFL